VKTPLFSVKKPRFNGLFATGVCVAGVRVKASLISGGVGVLY
jgi:hypothetical protein